MNFVLFFGGLSMLLGSCLIVCVCNQCKRRKIQKKDVQRPDKRMPHSLSFVMEPNTKSHSNGSVKSSDFTILPPKQFSPSLHSSVSSKDSVDSRRSLIKTKNSLASNSCMVLPAITVTPDRRSSSHPVIPTIYINSTCSSSSNV